MKRKAALLYTYYALFLLSQRSDLKPSFTLHGDVQSRASMYRQRLMFAQQRLLNSGKFRVKGLGNDQSSSKGNDIEEVSDITLLSL